MKEIFFMAGLQRSGATILSSILNQNPDLWVSPASPMLQMMINATQTFDSFEHKDYDRGNAISNAIAAIPQNFYYDKQANYIVDKNLNWTSVNGVEVAHRYINQNIKIICPVRDILDILVSFDTIINAHPESQQNALMDKEVLLETFPDKPMADRRADWLMKFGNDIMRCINNMKHAINPEYRHLFHFVEYDDSEIHVFFEEPLKTEDVSVNSDFLRSNQESNIINYKKPTLKDIIVADIDFSNDENIFNFGKSEDDDKK
jgi:hypothetical protein